MRRSRLHVNSSSCGLTIDYFDGLLYLFLFFLSWIASNNIFTSDGTFTFDLWFDAKEASTFISRELPKSEAEILCYLEIHSLLSNLHWSYSKNRT